MTGVHPKEAALGGEPIPASFALVAGLRTRYLDWPGAAPPIVLLHGLSANANEFAALGTSLSPHFRIVAPDLRGRGGTDKPATGYTMADHASDVLALLDALGLERVVLGGHSFGAFLAIYMAVFFPHRVDRLIVIDAAMRVHPRVREMLAPSLARLRQTFASADDYIEQIRQAPYIDGAWDWAMESYFRAEIVENPDGTVRSSTSAEAIAQAMEGVMREPWPELVTRVSHPTLLINATGDYGPPGSGALVTEESARETARLFPDAQYVGAPGNHLTMVFGDHARSVANAIESFLSRSA